MQDYLRVITPYLHPELVSVEALAHIQTVAQFLPPLSLAGFECRLGNGQSRVDFQVNIPLNPRTFPKQFLAYPQGKAFLDFFHNWNEPASLLNQYINRVILEFDLPNTYPLQVSIPCVFLDLSQTPLNETQEIISLALSQLNYPTSLSLQSNLQICHNSLPDGAKIDYLGVMLPRLAHGIRIVVKGISGCQLVDYLRKIGLTVSMDFLPNLILTLCQFSDSIALALNIDERIYPQIGLECFLTQQHPDESKWNLLLDYLVEKGLCTSVKHQALLTWPGFSQKADQPDLWPSNLDWGDKFISTQGGSVFWRKISHIKISYHPDVPLEAKAYLAFGHSWVPFAF
jgi:hypothetical protein